MIAGRSIEGWRQRALIDSAECRGVADRDVVQPVILGNRVTNADHSGRVEPDQSQCKVDELIASRHLTQNVQAVADLQIANLAQIAVNVLDEFAVGRVLRPSLDAQIPMQIRSDYGIPDLLLNELQLVRVDALGVGISPEELLQPREFVVSLSLRHRRDQVINDTSVHPPLGLRSFAGVVDNERIEDRQVADGELEITLIGETQTFTRQPFQGPVLAALHYRIGSEDIAQPAVSAKVMMRRDEVATVIDRERVLAETARRLDHHKDISVKLARDVDFIVASKDGPGRRAPFFSERDPTARWKLRKPLLVLAGGVARRGEAHLFFG